MITNKSFAVGENENFIVICVYAAKNKEAKKTY